MPLQVRDIAFLDTDTLFWQLAQQHSMQYQAHSRAGIPNLGRHPLSGLTPLHVSHNGVATNLIINMMEKICSPVSGISIAMLWQYVVQPGHLCRSLNCQTLNSQRKGLEQAFVLLRESAGPEGAPLADSSMRDEDCRDGSGVSSLPRGSKGCSGWPCPHLPGLPVQVLARPTW